MIGNGALLLPSGTVGRLSLACLKKRNVPQGAIVLTAWQYSSHVAPFPTVHTGLSMSGPDAKELRDWHLLGLEVEGDDGVLIVGGAI